MFTMFVLLVLMVMLMSWVFSLAYASVCAYALVKTSLIGCCTFHRFNGFWFNYASQNQGANQPDVHFENELTTLH